LRPRGRHHLLAGAELRSDFRQDQAIESPEYTFLDRRSSWNWGLFIQDEVSLAGKLSANLGVRHDHYGLTGGTTSPRIGLIFLPHEHSSLKLLFGQGFRPPNVYELYYDDGVTQRGGAGRLSSERVWTYEAAWEHGFGPHVRSTVSAYAYRLRGLTSQTTDPADGRIVYVNAGVINARGLEAEVQGRWKGGVEGRLSWAVQTAAEPDGHALSNSPRHLATLNLRLPLAPPRVSLGVEARYIARRRTLAGGQDPGHAVANVTLLARGLGRGLDVAASVCNVFDRRYGDPGSEEHLQDVIAQYGRTFRVTASGRF
jgi:iron complex outermembrane receptor protein